MQQWVCGEAHKLGFVAVVVKSNNGENNRKTFVVMVCQRGGSHKALHETGSQHDNNIVRLDL
jgi:hypothetical protein